MKKLFVLIVSIVALCAISCTPAANKPSDTDNTPPTTTDVIVSRPTAVATAVPTPTPAPQVYLLSEDETFSQAVIEQCPFIKQETPDYSQEGRIVAVVQGGSDEQLQDLLQGGAKVIVVSNSPHESENAIWIPYQPANLSEQLLDALLAYPPHDTPVRLLGMFSSDQSELKSLWNSRVDEGKIFAKGVYYSTDTEETADQWIARMLEKYVDGMIDGILCETEEQAILVAAALETAERQDRIEVFTLNWTEPQNPYVLGFAAPDYATAAVSTAAVVNAVVAEQPLPALEPYSDIVVVK